MFQNDLTLPATLMDEVKDAVEQEEDSGMNQLFPNNGFIHWQIIFYSLPGVLIKAGRPRSFAEFSRQKSA